MPQSRPENIMAYAPFVLVLLLGGIMALTLLHGPMSVIAIGAILGALIFAGAHPLVPFTLYFGILFFADTTFEEWAVTPNQALAPLFFLSTALYAIRRKTLPPRFALLPLFTLVAVYFALRGLTAQDLENGLLYTRYVVVYLVMAVCVAALMSKERTIYALAWIIVVLTTFAAISGFVEAIQKDILSSFKGWGDSYRIKGTAKNPVVFAWNMVFAFPFAFLLFAQMKSRYTRALALTLGLIILGAATLTFNRQTYIVMAVMLVMCTFLFTYRNRRVFVSLMLVFGTIISFTALPLIFKRFLTFGNLAKDYSFLERRDSYLIGMEMIKDSPVFGVGFGSYSKVWSLYIPPDYSTYFAQYRGGMFPKFMDMSYMSILTETGFIGLLLFIILIGTIFWRALQFYRRARTAGDAFARNFSAMILTVIVFYALTSGIQDTFLYTRIWIFYGLALLLDERILPIASTALPSPDSPPAGSA